MQIKDLIFTPECLLCKNIEDVWLCEACRQGLRVFHSGRCLWCLNPAASDVSDIAKATADGHLCAACQKASGLDGVLIVYDYADSNAAYLIETVKYNLVSELVATLSADLAKKVSLWRSRLGQPVIIMPVPLHRRRFRERGFNQAELIARSLGEVSGLAVINDGLKRARYTKQQAKLTRGERLKNLKGAFIFNGDYSPANVLLVDDVISTGSTLKECARVSRLAGAKKVWAAVLASSILDR